ncbi:MAG TPA: hypothetical protein DDZ68_01440, partial [Parvularcula sp.]|nr:hypothetical protein [Parvularcula sp.]HBS33919.1 hypothetical protein [Parvularcula sp.]
MVRPLIMGLGAAGALTAAAVTGVVVTRNDGGQADARAAQASLANAAAETVCIKSNVRLVEGMSAACYARDQYEAMRDRAVISADGGAVRLTLAHPTDASVPAVTVSTCAEYDTGVAEGWEAVTSADMRREEYFRRACGALGMLVKARPAQSSGFPGGKASEADIRSMAAAEALGFGEVVASVPVDVAGMGEGVWKLAIGQGETMVFEIAHADFTGDGAGEILAYLSVGAAGGTTRTGTIGLMEKTSVDGPCGFRPL